MSTEVETNGSHGTNGAIGEHSSVDEMFTKLSISEIQKISKDYKQHITTAKNDLHTLVGTKYRDLIKIAEDIDYMYTLGIETDQKLADLSYKPSKFVSFTNNNTSAQFDTLIRMKNAADARAASKLTILRNIINNKLVKLDLKMTSLSSTKHNSSPVIHTSNIIYYAKVYYTVEKFFGDVLHNNKHIMAQYSQSKRNFVAYIESQLASYNVLNTSYSSKIDRFRPTQDIKFEDLVSELLLVDDDTYDDEYDDDYDEEDADNFENEETVHSSFEANRNAEPLLNYLLSYIIINLTNPNLDTISKVAENFMGVRIKHLRLLLGSLEDSTKVNFLSIFKYLENTCTYVDKYFSRNSELLRELESYTKPWKPSSLVGFRGWLDEETISFNHDAYVNGLQSSGHQIVQDSFKILADTVFRFTQGIMKQPQLSTTLVVLHNVIISLKCLHDTMMLQNTKSQFLALAIDSKILPESLSQTTAQITTTFADHFDLLSSDSVNSIPSIIQLNITTVTNHTPLFSKDLVSIMEEDLEAYINVINKVTVSTENDSCSTLNSWFNSLSEYYDLTNINKEVDKLTPASSLSHLHSSISRLKEPWGTFSSTSIEEEFTTLRANLDTSFWKHINSLVSKIDGLLTDLPSNDIKSHYYLLEIFIVLKNRVSDLPEKNILALTDESNANDTIENIDSIVTKIYQAIVEEIPKKSFDGSYKAHIDSLLHKEFTEVPTRPSLRLTSLLYNLSTKYISIEPKSNSQYGHLFLDKSVKEIFVRIKNEWIGGVIEDIIERVKEKEKEKDEQDEQDEEPSRGATDLTKILTKSQAQSLLAEVLYLSHFNGNSSEIQKYVDIFNSKLEKDIDPVVVQIIQKGVAEVYKSHKNIYLPLLK